MDGCHQYDEGISSVQWRDIVSKVDGYIISTMEEFHEYSGGILSVLIGTGKFSVIETKITFALNG